LSAQQVIDAYNGNFNTKDQIEYLDFSEPIVAVNNTLVNGTQTNQTGFQDVNQTVTNETSTITDLAADNKTNSANTNNTQPIEIPKENNATEMSNESNTQEQQAPPSDQNNSPESFDQSVSLDQDNKVAITLLATDEDKDPLQFDITADPQKGGLVDFAKEKGTVTYVPQEGYFGSDKFSFRVIDNKGAQSNEADVELSVKQLASSEVKEQKESTFVDNSTNNNNDNTNTNNNDNTNTNNNDNTNTNNNDNTNTNNNVSEVEERNTATLEQPNQKPNADAGENQKVDVNKEVKLDGTKSSDEDGKIVEYKWEQTDGQEVDLKQPNEKTASFDVPESAADSKLVFKLTVTDDKGDSTSDDVTVEVNAIQNVPPKADAGEDQKVDVNKQVKLDGTKSSDEDGKIVEYKWEQTDGPEVDLKKADEQTANFDVPESAADSKLVFKLTVVDDKGDSAFDEVELDVQKIPVESN
jgi:hypothetical protein